MGPHRFATMRESIPGSKLRRRYAVPGVSLPLGLFLAMVFMALPPPNADSLQVHFSTIDVRGGVLWLGNTALSAGGQGAPSPLLNDIGVSLPLGLGPRFSIMPEMDLFLYQYQLATNGVQVVPTEIEYANSVELLTVMIDLAARYEFPINKTMSWGLIASPAFLVRIPTRSWGTGSDNIGTITGYFYKAARFFYPELGAFLFFQVLPRVGLEIRVRSFFPIFHLWDGEGDPFYDQMMVDGTIGLRFALGK